MLLSHALMPGADTGTVAFPGQPSGSTETGWALLTVLGCQSLVTGAFLLWAYTQPEQGGAGTCEGIGWGCAPGPRGGALTFGMVVGVPVLTVSTLLALGVAALLVRFHEWPGRGAGVVGWIVGWAVVCCAGPALFALDTG